VFKSPLVFTMVRRFALVERVNRQPQTSHQRVLGLTVIYMYLFAWQLTIVLNERAIIS
jgi:hypothetical protein